MPRGLSQKRLAMGEAAWAEYQKLRKRGDKGRSRSVVSWRVRVKQRLIAYKGGKCDVCGYDKLEYPSAFCFHHVNPKEKAFGISACSRSFATLKAEADKCRLMCVRCHAELHDDERSNERLAGMSGIAPVC